MKQAEDLTKLCQYRDKLAALVVDNAAYAPVFIRIEDEIAAAEAFIAANDVNDLLARARAISFHQRAMV